jgi:epoxyqueuosine reductase
LIPLKDLVFSCIPDPWEYVVGFAPLEGLLREPYNRFPSGIVIGKRLDGKILDSIADGPNREYYLHYKSVNSLLFGLAGNILGRLKGKQINCELVEPTFTNESEMGVDYPKTLAAGVSHKMLATRAGLGWIGKTDLLVSCRFGPRLRMVSILLDQPVEPEHEVFNNSQCGECRICVDSCPAKAANGIAWDIQTSREAFFDAHKCRQQCAIFGKERLNDDIRVCGICVSVCPFGK